MESSSEKFASQVGAGQGRVDKGRALTVWRKGSMPTRPPSGKLDASQSWISGHLGVPERIKVHPEPSCCSAYSKGLNVSEDRSLGQAGVAGVGVCALGGVAERMEAHPEPSCCSAPGS